MKFTCSIWSPCTNCLCRLECIRNQLSNPCGPKFHVTSIHSSRIKCLNFLTNRRGNLESTTYFLTRFGPQFPIPHHFHSSGMTGESYHNPWLTRGRVWLDSQHHSLSNFNSPIEEVSYLGVKYSARLLQRMANVLQVRTPCTELSSRQYNENSLNVPVPLQSMHRQLSPPRHLHTFPTLRAALSSGFCSM